MESTGIGETWIFQEFASMEDARDLAKKLGHSVWARIKPFRATWEVFSDHAVIHPDPCGFES
jgi:hypothetical protein